MYKIDFKNGFSDYNDYVFPKQLKWFLKQLRLFNYIDLMKDYKEPFFKSFTINKLPGPFVYHYDGWRNLFRFDDTNDMKHSKYPGWCWDNIMIYFIKYIVSPSVSNFLNKSKFDDDFYYNYAKEYYNKLATVKNNTIESNSLENTIVPFETAFNDFINSDLFEETINDLFNIIIRKSNRSMVEFKSNSVVEKCNISMYDLFFRPFFALKKIKKHIQCENDVENPFAFTLDKNTYGYPIYSSFGIRYNDINYKNFLNCVNTEKITEIDFEKTNDTNLVYTNYTVLYSVIKQIIRYVFVHQFKQSFGIYLNQLKTKDSNINSIINDTNFFYTNYYISYLKDNIKFYDNSITSCHELRKCDKKTLLEKIQPILTSIRLYWVGTVSRNIEHSDNYYTINSFIESSVQKIRYETIDSSDISELIDTILYLKKYDSEMMENMNNYSFVNKWNEINNKKELVADTGDSSISKYSFEIA